MPADLFSTAGPRGEEPHWVAHRKNKRAGVVWRGSDGLWHVQCGRGHLTFDNRDEAEQAVARSPAEKPPKPPGKKKPPPNRFLTAADAGFVVYDEKGREQGGAIGRNGGGYDCFAYGQELGHAATELEARIAIGNAALRIKHVAKP
jgi:hypothetical protein